MTKIRAKDCCLLRMLCARASSKRVFGKSRSAKPATCVRFTDSVQLKRQHSAEPLNRTAEPTNRGASGSPISGTPVSSSEATTDASTTVKSSIPDLGTESGVGSPFKKQRASLPGFDEGVRRSLGATLANAQKEPGNSESNVPTPSIVETKMEEDDEL